jgi:hypothetical protein
MTEDYDILPHDEIKRLKDEVKRLKSGTYSQELEGSIGNLTNSINSLLKIFGQAYNDMKMDEHDSLLLSERIEPLIAKLDHVLEQNEKIAKGIVAVADMVTDLQTKQRIAEKVSEPEPNLTFNQPPPPVQHNFAPPPSFAPVPASPMASAPPDQPKPLPTQPAPPADEPKKKKEPLIKFQFK